MFIKCSSTFQLLQGGRYDIVQLLVPVVQILRGGGNNKSCNSTTIMTTKWLELTVVSKRVRDVASDQAPLCERPCHMQTYVELPL